MAYHLITYDEAILSAQHGKWLNYNIKKVKQTAKFGVRYEYSYVTQLKLKGKKKTLKSDRQGKSSYFWEVGLWVIG